MIEGRTTAALSTVALLCALVLVVSLEHVRVPESGMGSRSVASLLCG